MKVKPEFVRIEILFNSVEIELARRWAFGNVPPVFVNRRPIHLRYVVKALWHLYHESSCARHKRDRAVWGRNPDYPAEALDTPTLVDHLQDIRQLLNLDDLLAFRPLSKSEGASLCLLALLTAYYMNPHYERWMQIL